MTIVFGQATHQGLKRADNQDACDWFPQDNASLASAKGQLFIVADGMGGHAGGKEASSMAVRLVREAYFAAAAGDVIDNLRFAFEIANEKIYQQARSSLEFRGMGTTCTALVLQKDRAYLAHVGDSRAYLITKSKITQLTEDHSKVAEMLRMGILNAEEAQRHPERSQLYRALGMAAATKADFRGDLMLQPGEWFLLCTDGIAKVQKHEIKRRVLSNPPQTACDKLIDLANERGGSDNSTVQIIAIKGEAGARSWRWWRAS